MIDINDIIETVRNGRVWVTDHADEEAHIDELSFDEIFASLSGGEIIEQYTRDIPYPSCLI
jgi:hypothetical protein